MSTSQKASWLPDTNFVELTSSRGHTYGVWITMPPKAVGEGPFPILYVTDGNLSLGLTAPLIVCQADPLQPIAPYIQVTIGYTGDEAEVWTQLRNRDLVPAGEPIGEEMVAALQYAVDSGYMTPEARDAYLQELSSTDAGAFLSFIVDELHPHLQGQYAVTDSGHGLFGYSYGGLFSLYAWLMKTALFSTIGAGSPGIATAKSTVFELFQELAATASADQLARLHFTVNELEMLGPQPVYRQLAQNTLTLTDQIKASPFDPLLTTEVLTDSHITGVTASFLSYQRTLRAG